MITLNGTTGITNDGGYTGDGVVFADTTPANTLVTTTGGNVGIGTSSPTARVSAGGGATTIQVTLVPEQGAATDYLMGTGYNVSHDGSNWQTQLAGSNGGAFIGSNWGDGALRFYTIGNTASGNRTFSNAQFAALERARIDSSGKFFIGGTSLSNDGRFNVIQDAAANEPMCINDTSGSSSQLHAISFQKSGTEVGSIRNTNTTTSYITSSDYRLKNITGPITTSGAYIDSLKPVEGTWKADGSTFVGLIAHEVQEASRTNVATGVKDGEEMQGMDYSSAEIIANLIAEVKALRARMAVLEAK